MNDGRENMGSCNVWHCIYEWLCVNDKVMYKAVCSHETLHIVDDVRVKYGKVCSHDKVIKDVDMKYETMCGQENTDVVVDVEMHQRI